MQKKSDRTYTNHLGSQLRDIILGGQDGIVNILGLVLGVAAATNEPRVVLIAGLASTCAESISMAAVAYTSSKAANAYYLSERAHERQAITQTPIIEKKHIRAIYAKKGFYGKELELIVQRITANKRLWVSTLLSEELKLSPIEYKNPFHIGLIVGIASLLGSLIPLIPFVFIAVKTAIWASFFSCILVLFLTGAIKARITVGDWKRSGIEMAAIGTIAALAGYGIGHLLGTVPF